MALLICFFWISFLMLLWMVLIFSIAGFISVIIKYKYFLSVLISLEFLIISIFLIFVIMLQGFSVEVYIVLYLLTFTSCASALGLSVLVFMVRSRGSEYFSLLNLVSW